MIIKTLNRSEAQAEMNNWIQNCPELPEVDSEYLKIRNDLMDYNCKMKENYSKDYDIDINFGMYLYNYLWNIDGFNMRAASNDDFWRYLSIIVIPNIVKERWDNNEDHFWKRSSRIWLRVIWWYIHLSWQGDAERTNEVIQAEGFSTDEILNLVERAGRKGYYVNVYRYIMYFYSNVSYEKKVKYKLNKKTLFRTIMILNTARCMVVDPALCLGGEREYVRSLYRDLNIEI